MSTHTAGHPHRPVVRPRPVAVGLAGLMAVVYGLIWAGLLDIGRADTGELGILGVAGLLFAAAAVVIARLERVWVWATIAVVQVPIAAMYVAIAPDRDPAFEVWGITLRVLQVLLLVVLVLGIRELRRR